MKMTFTEFKYFYFDNESFEKYYAPRLTIEHSLYYLIVVNGDRWRICVPIQASNDTVRYVGLDIIHAFVIKGEIVPSDFAVLPYLYADLCNSWGDFPICIRTYDPEVDSFDVEEVTDDLINNTVLLSLRLTGTELI
jgi:hypothetical protein